MITTLFVILVGSLSFSWTLNPLDHALVHHSENVRKVDLTKDDIARTGKSDLEQISQFDGIFGAFQFTNESDSQTISTDWEVIEFKLKICTNETVFKVEIFNQTESKQSRYSRNKQHKLLITPQPAFRPFMDINYDAHLGQVNITLLGGQLGFALWDIIVNHNISISSKQVNLREKTYGISERTLSDMSYGRQVYLINSSITTNPFAYMNFTFDDADSSAHYCFWPMLGGKMSIDVYVSLFGAKQANKLTRIEHSTQLKSDNFFCLPQYLYLRQLGKFELSLVFYGHVATSEAVDADAPLLFSFESMRIERKTQNFRKYLPEPNYLDAYTVTDSAREVGWWYNNPSLFGYTIVAASSTPLYVCDILANCYQYERSQLHEGLAIGNESVHTYTLDQKYKQLLSYSPLIRLRSNGSESFVIYRNRSIYSRAYHNALAQIKANLGATFPKLHSLGPRLNIFQLIFKKYQIFSYRAQVTRQNRIALKIPIRTIDPRAQRFVISIESDSSDCSDNSTATYNAVNLHAVKVNGVNKLNSTILNCTNYFKITTSDYIQVPQWKMVHDFKSFEVEFEFGGKSDTHNETHLVDLLIDVSLEGMDTSRLDKMSEKSLKFGIENCHKGPAYGEFDCRQDEYQCPEYYFKYNQIAKTCTRTDAPLHQ